MSISNLNGGRMLFKPTLKSVTAKKLRALSVFETTRLQLSAAVQEFKDVIGIADAKMDKLREEMNQHAADVTVAKMEIQTAEDTIKKITSIVGA